VKGEQAFVLKLIRARERERAGEVFLARHDERATWLDQLRALEGDWNGELDRGEDQAATRRLAVV
jgi:hypothetical protein